MLKQPASQVLAFLGLHNLAVSRRQPKGENGTLISMADCQNIQLDDEGGVSSRDGNTLAMPTTGITAAFNIESYQYGYIVDNGTLKRVNKDLSTADLGIVSIQPTEWLEVGTRVFMSTGYLIDNNALMPWVTPVPVQPDIIIGTGYLAAGQYQLTITSISPDGRESGSCEVIPLNLADNSGLALVGTQNCMVYITPLNGSVFYEVGIGVTVIDSIAQLSSKSINPNLLIMQSVPQGIDKIAYYNECLHCSIYDKPTNSSSIFFSKPFLFNVFDWFSDVISDIAGEIRLLYGMPEGLLIGTDREILLYNVDSGTTKLAGYGVASGKPIKRNRDGQIFIQSLRGVCTMPFKNLTGDKYTAPLGGECSTAILDSSGTELFITITDGFGQTEDSVDF